MGCEIKRSRLRRQSILTSASDRSTCLPGRAPRTLRSLSIITSTGSLKRVTPPMLVAGSAAGSVGEDPPAASPFDDMAAASLSLSLSAI